MRIIKTLTGDERKFWLRIIRKETSKNAYGYRFAFVIVPIAVFLFWLVFGYPNCVIYGAFITAFAIYDYWRSKESLKALDGLKNKKELKLEVETLEVFEPEEIGVAEAFKRTVCVSLLFTISGIAFGYFFTHPIPKAEYLSYIESLSVYELFKKITLNNLLVSVFVFLITMFTGFAEIGLIVVINTAVTLGAVSQYGDPLTLILFFLGNHGAIELGGFTVSAFSGKVVSLGFGGGKVKLIKYGIAFFLVSIGLILAGAYIEATHSVPKLIELLSG